MKRALRFSSAAHASRAIQMCCLSSDDKLSAINLQLAKSQTVLNAVSSQLGSKVDVDNIQAGALPNTLIVQIKIQDTDPQRATTIANLLVQELIQQNEFLLSEQYTGFENAIIEQIEQVQKVNRRSANSDQSDQ